MKFKNLYLACVAVCFYSIAIWANVSEPKIVGSISTHGLTQADYPKAAKVTVAQAKKAAMLAVAGKIVSAGLEQEDGFLVYAVVVSLVDSELREVLVDAGSGKVLLVEKEDGEED